jgi:membrane protein DedA with SNARE-associated domain
VRCPVNSSPIRSHTRLVIGYAVITAIVAALSGAILGYLIGYTVAAERFLRAIRQINQMFRGEQPR